MLLRDRHDEYDADGNRGGGRSGGSGGSGGSGWSGRSGGSGGSGGSAVDVCDGGCFRDHAAAACGSCDFLSGSAGSDSLSACGGGADVADALCRRMVGPRLAQQVMHRLHPRLQKGLAGQEGHGSICTIGDGGVRKWRLFTGRKRRCATAIGLRLTARVQAFKVQTASDRTAQSTRTVCVSESRATMRMTAAKPRRHSGHRRA